MKLFVKLAHNRSLFPPGKGERYSNSGFAILAATIDKVSGEDYDGFLREHIFHPLHMNDTANFPAETIMPGRVHKYQPGPPPDLVWNVPVEDLSYSTGAGSASSAAEDLLLWLEASR